MGCNCKGEKRVLPVGESKKINLPTSIFNYSIKTFGFLLFIIILPIINLVILWSVFRILVLNKDTDVKGLLTMMLSKLKPKDDDYDDYDDLTEDDVELVEDIEDITEEINHK